MAKAVLLVDDNDRRRREVAAELSARQVPVLEVGDAFEAMATLGRAAFGAVVLGEGRRRLSLRGLCHLARRRHPSVRLVVLADAAVEPRTVEVMLGLPVDVLDADGPPGGIAAQVLTLMARPLDPFVEPPNTDVVERAIADAVTESLRGSAPAEKPPVWDAPTLSSSPSATPRAPAASATNAGRPSAECLLEGVLEEETATALLMGIFSQELTGRLEVTGGAAAGTLYFYRGEPVAADHAFGNAGLLEELERHDLVPESLDIGLVPEGELLATLVAAGNVTGEAMHRFVGGFVRKRLLELVTQQDGTYRFLEDRRFLDSAPLLRVNPFGVMLERRRGATPPPELQATYDDIAGRYVTPRPALRLAADKLRAFAGGYRLDEVIGEGLLVSELLAKVGTGDIMGTLLLLTLEDGRLIELATSPGAERQERPRPVPAPVLLDEPLPADAPVLALPEAETANDDEGAPLGESEDAARLREEILHLYMRLKPLSRPRQVLGVPLWADPGAVEAAYQRRLAELDPRRVPEGPSRDMLVARIEELRGKVIRAMEVLRFEQGAGSTTRPLSETPPVDDSNPF